MIALTFFLTFCNLILAQNGATRNLLTDEARDSGSVCLDGTPAAYYLQPGTGDGVNKWFLHFQGGGYCGSLADCYDRSLGSLGSSKSYPPTMGLGGGYFSTDVRVNPLMYNWNHVLFPYCDGAYFSGNNETVSQYNGHNLYFRGFRNVQGYYHHLAANHGLLSGTDFIIGGCSAGAIATYYNIDWWRQTLPATSVVKGLPDSGFFEDVTNTDGGKVVDAAMNWIFKQMNTSSGLNQGCIAAHTVTGNPVLCHYAEYNSPYITTPIFPLQSQFDSWQIENFLKTNDAVLINQYGQQLENRFKDTVMKNPKNGCFFDSCYHHCGQWDSIRISNTLSGDALKGWYLEQNSGIYFQDKQYPCPTCCQP